MSGKRKFKCAKCALSSNEDSTLTFHRFPLPSVHGSLKAKVWAKFCFPNGDWSSDQSLYELYKQNKVLCCKHFDESSFTSSDRKRLNKFAIPTEARNILAQLREELLKQHIEISSEDCNVILHSFPNPVKEEGRFRTWLYSIGGDILVMDSQFVSKNRKVCHKHFETKYHTRSSRLSANAVPTLHLKGLGDTVLHKFPNPNKDPTRFLTWVQAVGGNLLCLDNMYVFKYRRICHMHFEPKYWTRSKCLSNIAIPTLQIKGHKDKQAASSSAMAIVEDEARNESEDENDIDVAAEENEAGQQDSDDSEEDDDDDDAVDAALESKVAKLEQQLTVDSYSYEDHLELVKALWALSDLERWRSAFDRFISHLPLKPEDWLLRLRIEISLSHTSEDRENIAKLFEQASLDCYSVEVLSEWCSWSLSAGDSAETRAQLRRILDAAAADPLSGKLFWDALLEFEKTQLDTLRNEDQDSEECTHQRERVCRCLEEIVSRPLLRSQDAWQQYEQTAPGTPQYTSEYVAATLKRHQTAMNFVKMISPFEDKLLLAENDTEETLQIYEKYLEEMEALCKDEEYAGKKDYMDALQTVYERACSCGSGAKLEWMQRWCSLARRRGTAAYSRALRACARRQPTTHHFHAALMQLAETTSQSIDEVHAVFEAALLRGMETFKEGELLWMAYIEYKRRQTDFSRPGDVDRLRSTFRLAWDSLATCYGEEANDCEVPLYWARIEYQRIKAPQEGRDVFEEIFKYGINKTKSKYWESFLRFEQARSPPLATHKMRELFRRGLNAVTDYLPSIGELYRHFEQDYGDLESSVKCSRLVEESIKEWRESYRQLHNTNKTGNKRSSNDLPYKHKSKKSLEGQNENKHKSKPVEKRKVDGGEGSSGVKKKRQTPMDVDDGTVRNKGEKPGASTSQGVKRSHESNAGETESKKPKIESEDASSAQDREACTLFVSNLEFKVNEPNLREKLSQFGEIASLRVKSGVKAFGGSICYCQYTTPEAVSRAVQHDRTLLDGRPMFLSRYSSTKTKPQFKYATDAEKNKLFVKNLPFKNCTKEELTKIFEPHGQLNDIRIVTQKDGKPRGLAYVEYSDAASAARAIEATHGLLLGDRSIDVAISAPPPRDAPHRAQREPPNTMRRTKLSSFVPSVLLKAASAASTSKAAASDAVEDRKPKSNSDFRSLLLSSQK